MENKENLAESIVQVNNPVLRKKAVDVNIDEINSEKIQSIISEMKKVMATQKDGVAIAAPQIGESLRIFVVAERASKLLKEDTVFINPEIIRLGKKKENLSEGCLSVRWKYGLVKRSTTATVKALNAEGNEFVMSGRGLLAQIFQHETDHLNGALFIDKATEVQDIPPEK